VYRRHAGDFTDYHTRYVTPDNLRDALRTPDGASRRPIKAPIKAPSKE
jgi:hypothetical protein